MANEDTQDEAQIVENLRDAQTVDLPSEFGGEEVEASMTVKRVGDPGLVYIWDTKTYEKVPVLRYMLDYKLRQKRDGVYRFTAKDPQKKPLYGHIKCMLHKDDPNRELYDTMGFPVCNKENIKNLHQQRYHMKRKHPMEWDSIEESKKEKERAEDRKLQQLLLKNQAKERKKGKPA